MDSREETWGPAEEDFYEEHRPVPHEPLKAGNFMWLIRRVVREELRRCDIRPVPSGAPGAWRWDAERDEWVAPE